MTKCYSIWTDVEENKELKNGLKKIKFAIDSHIQILKLKKGNYIVDVEYSLKKLKETTNLLLQYFPKEGDNVCEDVWLDYKEYYFEDGSIVETTLSEEEMQNKKLNILKKKISFVSSYLPKVRTIKGKDSNGEAIEEEVITEAYTDISIKGQQCILDNFYQFQSLLEQL